MADDSYGSIEAPEPPQESFLCSEPTPVPAQMVEPSTDGWRCCQYWDGEYHV